MDERFDTAVDSSKMLANGSKDASDLALKIAHSYAAQFRALDVETMAVPLEIAFAAEETARVTEKFLASFGLGINAARFAFLRILYFAPGMRKSLGEIAQEMFVTSPNVTYLIAALARQGLAKRVVSPEERLVYAELTPKGEEVCAILVPEMVNLVEEAMAPITSEEKQQLMRILTKYRQHLAEMFATGQSSPGRRARSRI